MKIFLMFVCTVTIIVITMTDGYSQKKIFIETGLTAGMEATSLNVSINYFDKKNFFAGGGFNLFGIMSYNGFKEPAAKTLQILSPLFDIQDVEERGPFGLGGGFRIFTNFGVGIEGGVMATWKSKYTTYKLFDADFKYAWDENKFKLYPYGRIIVFTPENKFTIGFEMNEVIKAGAYIGYKF